METKPLIIAEFTLTGFQNFNLTMYQMQNDQNYLNPALISRLHRFATRLLKSVRTGQTGHANYWLCITFSWLMALANRYHIDLEQVVSQHYDGVCPHCKQIPCLGEGKCRKVQTDGNAHSSPYLRHLRRQHHLNTQGVAEISQKKKLRDIQTMLTAIYPGNTLKDSAMHLAEEVGELAEAIEYFAATHDRGYLIEIMKEMADVLAHICAIATCLKLDLATEMQETFKNGCVGCHLWECECGFTAARPPKN